VSPEASLSDSAPNPAAANRSVINDAGDSEYAKVTTETMGPRLAAAITISAD